ncbi:MAG: acetone carboxylase [Micrococcaceae bacterium]
MDNFFQELDYIKCSRAKCTNEAEYVIYWNNPKVHTPDRRKEWTSCEVHKKFFENYLSVRNFYIETLPLE